jgi:hypothetical protein
MPPRKSDTGRKSDASTAAADKSSAASPSATGEASTQNATAAASTESGTTGKAEKKDRDKEMEKEKEKDKEKEKEKDHDKTTIEDLTLPRSIITRLAKGVLPQNTQVQANAILAMSKSTTVFINYLAAQYCFPLLPRIFYIVLKKKKKANNGDGENYTVQTKLQ